MSSCIINVVLPDKTSVTLDSVPCSELIRSVASRVRLKKNVPDHKDILLGVMVPSTVEGEPPSFRPFLDVDKVSEAMDLVHQVRHT